MFVLVDPHTAVIFAVNQTVNARRIFLVFQSRDEFADALFAFPLNAPIRAEFVKNHIGKNREARAAHQHNGTAVLPDGLHHFPVVVNKAVLLVIIGIVHIPERNTNVIKVSPL